MAQPQPLPVRDETSEDTLSTPLPSMEVDPRLVSIERGVARPRIGLGPHKFTCTASMSEAVIEDRR